MKTKLTLTYEEHEMLLKYVEFCKRNTNPCSNCPPDTKRACCGCPKQREYNEKRKQIIASENDEEILKNPIIQDYVGKKLEIDNLNQQKIIIENKIAKTASELDNIMTHQLFVTT